MSSSGIKVKQEREEGGEYQWAGCGVQQEEGKAGRGGVYESLARAALRSAGLVRFY